MKSSFFAVALTVTFVSLVSGRSVDLTLRSTQKLNYLYKFGYLKTKDPTIEQQKRAITKYQKATNLVSTEEEDDNTLKQNINPSFGDPDSVRVNSVKTKDQTIEQQKRAIAKYQKATNLVSTEEVDDNTLKQNIKPSSEDPDKVQVDRVKRFAFLQTRWKKIALTFGIYKYPTNTGTTMTQEEIWDVITDAFEHWENVTHIRYEGIGPKIVDKEDVDIAIGWEKDFHGDCSPFDGSSDSWLGVGNTLAHAFPPQYGGDIHFDDSEVWGLSRNTTWTWGIFEVTILELFKTALHEIGHTLGLAHSKDVKAVMWKSIQNWTGLSQDDINGVQGLYGEPTGKKENVAYGNYPSSICQVDKFDAVIGNSTFFIGDQFWMISNDYNDVLPRNISDVWEDLPGNLDAAVFNNDVYYFFKDDLVYAYYDFNTMLTFKSPCFPKPIRYFGVLGFPKQISAAFPGFPNNLDGAFSIENEVYFVKGDYYGKDTTQFQFPSHPLVAAPFDDVEVDSNLIRFIKNGKEFIMENNAVPPQPIYSIWSDFVSMFLTSNLHVRDLRHHGFQCKNFNETYEFISLSL